MQHYMIQLLVAFFHSNRQEKISILSTVPIPPDFLRPRTPISSYIHSKNAHAHTLIEVTLGCWILLESLSDKLFSVRKQCRCPTCMDEDHIVPFLEVLMLNHVDEPSHGLSGIDWIKHYTLCLSHQTNCVQTL